MSERLGHQGIAASDRHVLHLSPVLEDDPSPWLQDPHNRLLARRQVPGSGRTDPRRGARGRWAAGRTDWRPSVKPYQPPGLWKETSNRPYVQDSGAALYRRSLYTYWKRSVPPPNLFALDAPTRETCITRRQRTNTPLMALVLMNDPTFVEAARGPAVRTMLRDAVTMWPASSGCLSR
ncbi:MAG: hypothetical protein CM1200mP2_20720 [Planctomycetaceae bacterium]|nr:MAG: hypothetical protein CM1200mP2_20720 [Planctomycetaceae bacterium]